MEYNADTLRPHAPANTPKERLAELAEIVNRVGLDPAKRQLVLMTVGGKVVLHVSIDGMRVLATRSGQYAGQLGPAMFTADGITWTDTWLDSKPPVACRVQILRKDWQHPLVWVLTWKDYTQGNPNQMQSKMAMTMLRKATESQGLRAAVANEAEGLYTDAEMAPVYDHAETKPAPPAKKERSNAELLAAFFEKVENNDPPEETVSDWATKLYIKLAAEPELQVRLIDYLSGRGYNINADFTEILPPTPND